MTTLDQQPRTKTLLSRRNVVIAAIVLAIVAVVGLVWFQPQKLFIDATVNEAAPEADAMPDTLAGERRGDEPVGGPMRKRLSLEGSFSSLAHETTGTALVTELADGSRVLRLEDFETSNGPDVRVYLSTGEPYGKDFVDLGGLKGNVGNQNYTVPSDVDLERYDTAVIWCRRFTVAFGAAELA
jgi:hypothetical protein